MSNQLNSPVIPISDKLEQVAQAEHDFLAMIDYWKHQEPNRYNMRQIAVCERFYSIIKYEVGNLIFQNRKSPDKVLSNNITGSSCGFFSSNYSL